jgi:hypothetical protein
MRIANSSLGRVETGLPKSRGFVGSILISGKGLALPGRNSGLGFKSCALAHVTHAAKDIAVQINFFRMVADIQTAPRLHNRLKSNETRQKYNRRHRRRDIRDAPWRQHAVNGSSEVIGNVPHVPDSAHVRAPTRIHTKSKYCYSRRLFHRLLTYSSHPALSKGRCDYAG